MIYLAFLALAAFIDWYFYQAIKITSRQLPKALRNTITVVYFSITVVATLAVLINKYWIGFHHWPLFLKVYIPGFAMTFMLCKLMGLIFVILDDMLLGIQYLIKKIRPVQENNTDLNISRKVFLNRAAIITMALPLMGFIYGMVRGAFNYDIKKVALKLKNLPKAFEGLRIVQFSDVHAGSFVSNSPIKEFVDLINSQNADIIFFTGDLVNEIADEADPFIETLREIKAPMGVFSILGNHDYGDYYKWDHAEDKIANLDKMKKHHEAMGWRLMLNETILLKKDNEEVALIGMENWGKAKRFRKLGDVDKAMKGSKKAPVKLLLSHDPSHWDYHVRGKNKGIDITFAGHTHGMQFGVEIPGFKWSPSKYLYTQWAGLYNDGDQQLYVNQGIGFVAYPGRLGISPEITVFTLEKG